MQAINEQLNQLTDALKPQLQVIAKALEPLQPVLQELSKPILGPFKGWHVLILIFYIFSKVFESGTKANASHILVKDEKECLKIKKEIEDGADFGELAKKHSTCPSGKNKGSLGEFKQGQMVPEFDKVVFDPKTVIGQVYGPIKTQFGFHLILVNSRKE
ncbi:hypothetical protein EDD86DRAFT_250172 [Gorgonomyces haynaldii]|nr:hypothetical protein EDD86DRAFT_250172 [Gorgonomyces haynaldii]